jgi:hypothetical protein
LVHLVSFTQPKKPDKPDNSLLTLADFFSMLLALLGRVGNKRRIELLNLGAAAFRACHFVGFMLLQCQDHQRFLSAVQTLVVIHGHAISPLPTMLKKSTGWSCSFGLSGFYGLFCLSG